MAGAEDLDNMTAQARKRRMERRAKRAIHADDVLFTLSDDEDTGCNKKARLDETESVPSLSSGYDSSYSETSDTTSATSKTNCKKTMKLSKDALAKIPGVKKQARYVPAVPMSKEELTMWRKEARRVRNRESAAASRQKTQKRIVELEGEVSVLTKKYEAALRRIVELEAAAAASQGNSSTPDVWTTLKSQKQRLAPPSDGSASPTGPPPTVSPPLSPRDSFSLYQDQSQNSSQNNQDFASSSDSWSNKYQHTIDPKISRPDARVKIPNWAPIIAATISLDGVVDTQLPSSTDGNPVASASNESYSVSEWDDRLPVQYLPGDGNATTYGGRGHVHATSVHPLESQAHEHSLLEIDDTELGDFLMDAMADVGDVAAAEVMEKLPPPPLLLPPAAVGEELNTYDVY